MEAPVEQEEHHYFATSDHDDKTTEVKVKKLHTEAPTSYRTSKGNKTRIKKK